MKAFAVLYIFFALINVAFNFVPIWDLKKSSIELGKSGTIKLYEKTSQYPKINLYKEFEIKEDKTFSEKNYIVIDGSTSLTNEVDWEDIEIYYHRNDKYYICPKGKAFISRYEGSSYTVYTPSSFYNDNSGLSNEDNWELTCYYNKNRNIIYQGFLNQKKIKKMYGSIGFNYDLNTWENIQLPNPFFDFIWTDDHSTQKDVEYEMITLTLGNSKVLLTRVLMTIDWQSQTSSNQVNEKELDSEKDFTSAYFNHETNYFYWVSASSSNDYSSGYSTASVNVHTIPSGFTSFVKNTTSPLQFLNNVIINKLNMIRNTKYAYYEVTSKEDNKKHYGIIDIEKNQVIFNTNEALIEFKPISNTSMLAVTEDSAYQVCFMKEDGICKTECSNGKTMIIDASNGNFCGTSKDCEDGIIFKPDNICIHSCNTSIYVDYNDQCGLCKTFFPGQKEFKIFNEDDCLEVKPSSTYYISEEFKILGRCIKNCLICSNKDVCETCNEGYSVENGKCVKKGEEKECYEKCKYCTEKGNESDQKCTECNEEGDLLQEGNCVEICNVGYYQEEKNCKKCNTNCESCSIGEEIKEGRITNENCDSCKNNYYLINATNYSSNCVEKCPEELEIEGKYCIEKTNSSDPTPNQDPQKNDKKKGDYMIWIFIILIGIILLVLSLCICKKNCSRKKSDGEIMNDINADFNTELRENNNNIIE